MFSLLHLSFCPVVYCIRKLFWHLLFFFSKMMKHLPRWFSFLKNASEYRFWVFPRVVRFAFGKELKGTTLTQPTHRPTSDVAFTLKKVQINLDWAIDRLTAHTAEEINVAMPFATPSRDFPIRVRKKGFRNYPLMNHAFLIYVPYPSSVWTVLALLWKSFILQRPATRGLV